jgi:phage gp36-like protein
MAYITQAELQYALSSTSFIAIFDQDNDGVADEAVVDAVIGRASAMTDAWIAPVYRGPFPITQVPVPAMIRELTIQYCLAIAYERRPDYTRTLEGGSSHDEDRWKRADAMGMRLQTAVLRIPDYVAQPAPANVGGIVVSGGSRVFIADANGTENRGDF